jgi:hypothetical protein
MTGKRRTAHDAAGALAAQMPLWHVVDDGHPEQFAGVLSPFEMM